MTCRILVFIGTLCLSAILVSCDITDRDILDPRLPEYTETGRNSAGCYVNDQAWRKVCVLTPWGDCRTLNIHSDTINQKIRISMSGGLFQMDGSEASMELSFDIYNRMVRSVSDLDEMHGEVFQLNGIEASAHIGFGQLGEVTCEDGPISSTGLFHLRKARSYNYEDGREYGVISGTFGFDMNSACWEYAVYQGRYDFDVLPYINYESW